MGFSATYWQTPVKKKKPRWLLAVGIAMVIAGVLVSPLGKKCVYWMLPGDGEVTAHALESFAEDLKAGEAFSDAAEAFCLEILDEE